MAPIWDKSHEEEEEEEEEKEEVCFSWQTLETRKTKLWLQRVFFDNIVAVVVAESGEVL